MYKQLNKKLRRMMNEMKYLYTLYLNIPNIYLKLMSGAKFEGGAVAQSE